MQKKIAIVGAQGYVGREMVKLFSAQNPVLYDLNLGTKEEVNACDVAFVCVPTPTKEGGFCDTSIVEEVVSWLETPLIVIRSTVEPGTTDRLAKTYGKRIVFQPEYVGETPAHPLNDSKARPFLIFGGPDEACEEAIDTYQMVYNAATRIFKTTAKTAEVIKYTENSFIGTYVTFLNEIYQICQNLGVDYSSVREGFLLDPRMTPYWTFIFKDKRGFDGKCIPKDVNALAACVEATTGYDPKFLKAVIENNDRLWKFSKSS